jgi:DNA-binding response OmpR family regulator
MEKKPAKILIIDDSEVVLEIAKETLEKAGCLVAIAIDLKQFENEIEMFKPDLLVADIKMPEIFGQDLCSLLKEHLGVTIPVILFSDMDQEELEVLALQSNADGFVSKGDGMDALVLKIGTILKR